MIKNLSNGEILADRARVADTFWLRLRGLIGKKQISTGEALIISPCSGIHTWFMRFSLDVVFLDQDSRVIKLLEQIGPFRFSPLVAGACQVIELPTGKISLTGTTVGDFIKIYEGVQS